MLETIAYAVTSIGAIGGWIYTIRRNGHREGKIEQQIESLSETTANLPCIKNHTYMLHAGKLEGIMEQVEVRLANVESQVSAIRTTVEKDGNA